MFKQRSDIKRDYVIPRKFPTSTEASFPQRSNPEY